MNIFILDPNPETAAKYHCDKHVVKMILESAQILCTNAHYVGYDGSIPYKATHQNHPATVWARESRDNFQWLTRLMVALHHEWTVRYNHKDRIHKSFQKIFTELNIPKVIERLPNIGLTPFKPVMPDEYIVPGDPVESYRNYYKKGKADILKYTNTKKPEWIQ